MTFMVLAFMGAMLSFAMSGVAQPKHKVCDVLEPLNFGAIYVGAMGGTVTVRPDATRSATGGILICSDPRFDFGPALLSLDLRDMQSQGNQDDDDQISLLFPSIVTLSCASGGHLTITDLTKSSFRTIANGRTCYVGGTMHISGSQPVGAYAGYMDVEVVYP